MLRYASLKGSSVHAQFTKFICVTALAGTLSEVEITCTAMTLGTCTLKLLWLGRRAAVGDVVRVSQQHQRDTKPKL